MLKFLSSPILNYYDKLMPLLVQLAEEEGGDETKRVLVGFDDADNIEFKMISASKKVWVWYAGTYISVNYKTGDDGTMRCGSFNVNDIEGVAESILEFFNGERN